MLLKLKIKKIKFKIQQFQPKTDITCKDKKKMILKRCGTTCKDW